MSYTRACSIHIATGPNEEPLVTHWVWNGYHDGIRGPIIGMVRHCWRGRAVFVCRLITGRSNKVSAGVDRMRVFAAQVVGVAGTDVAETRILSTSRWEHTIK